MSKMRHYQRYTVLSSGFIFFSPVRKAEFSINNISASGMNITAKVELEEHEAFMMEIQIYGKLFPVSKQMKGRVVRKRRHNSIYHYGIRFIDMTHKDIVELDEYLRLNHDSTAFHDPSRDAGHDENPIRRLVRTNDT